MFETLTGRLQEVIKDLGRRGKLREADVDAALRDVRLALLEADVHYQVTRELLDRVRTRALQEEVSRALNPGQQVVRVLHEELARVLGDPGELDLSGATPRAIMLVGLQGSGKTTTAAKLGLWLRERGERVWLVAADPYRPAASDQLATLAEELKLPVFAQEGREAVSLSVAGMEAAGKAGASVAILDTAGRSQLDADMMHELEAIRDRVRPVETLLVADAMTGQEAVNIAQGFHQALGLTGLVLTKMDGDARGGAAISMRSVVGAPIKFIGTGESRQALEAFEPGRLASRVLGMGDVVGLIEKAERAFDADQAEAQAKRLARGEFSLEDFAAQLEQLQHMGPLGKVLELLPGGLGSMAGAIDGQAAERQLSRTQAIIRSMTPLERRKPDVLNASRKRRVAAGSGTTVQEVNQLLRQHRQMHKLFRQISKGGLVPKAGRWPR